MDCHGNHRAVQRGRNRPFSVIAAAYAYAGEEGGLPRELEMLYMIDRFGVGVLGRAPGAGELRRMMTAEETVKAYFERERAENWVAWATANKHKASLLEIGARMTNGE